MLSFLAKGEQTTISFKQFFQETTEELEVPMN